MPTMMPHASIGEALDVLQKQDMSIRRIPEIDSVVGKIGRAETALDPAPISMVKTVINYSPKYLADDSGKELREATLIAGKKRIRPCLMTTATTILALIPVLTSTGRGSDVMVPMAIPSFGGMLIQILTMFIVPVCYTGLAELKLAYRKRTEGIRP